MRDDGVSFPWLEGVSVADIPGRLGEEFRLDDGPRRIVAHPNPSCSPAMLARAKGKRNLERT
jgi:hypothetical protein